MRRGAWFLLCGLILLAPAFAADIPLDDAGFTAYIQQKIQLYSPMPVRVTGPFAIAIGGETGVNLVYGFKPLHDDCVAAPAQCPQKTHDFIQGIVGRFPAAAAEPPPPPTVPSDRGAFMSYLAAGLGRMLPGATIAADGLTLQVTRPGGRAAIPFDESAYYQLCREAEFRCDAALAQALKRTADWLALPDAAGLRVSLHMIADCHGQSCAATPSPDAMAPFTRKAFANLEELCFKPVPGGDMVPMTNADRRDMGLDIDAALDLCEKSTRAALGPLAPPPPGAGGIVQIAGPYAASRALFAADWAPLLSGGHLLIAVPQRDMLLIVKGDDADTIAMFGPRALNVYLSDPSLRLGMDIYRWNGGGWSLATARSLMDGGPMPAAGGQ